MTSLNMNEWVIKFEKVVGGVSTLCQPSFDTPHASTIVNRNPDYKSIE